MVAPVAAAAAPSLLSSIGGGAGIGSILSGIGSIGGLFGGKSRKGDPVANYMWREQMNLAQQQYGQERQDRLNAISNAAADARRAGLHPLFALGGGAGGYSPASLSMPSPPIAGQSESGSRIGDALQGIGNAVSGFSRATQQRMSRYDEARTQQAEAEAMKSRFDLMLLQEEYARTRLNPNSVGQSTPVSSVPDLPKESFVRNPTEALSLFIPVQLSDGTWTKTVNPELEDVQSYAWPLLKETGGHVMDWFRDTSKWRTR